MQGSLFFIMGVSGCGKSTIGQLLAEQINAQFYDGDDFHPKANIEKMSAGKALNDEDRQGWLKAIREFAQKAHLDGPIVIACSALKNKYRVYLQEGIENPIQWIYLKGTFDLILERMNQRQGHFMPSDLLKSQFDDLEAPNTAILCDIAKTPDQIIKQITDIMMNQKADFGLAGLGVMGKSLSRNLAQKGFHLALFNRHLDGVEEKVAERFVAEFEELNQASGHDDLLSFVDALLVPRKIFLMIPAGAAVDAMLDQLSPLLAPGDLIIDGGNTHFKDTERRHQAMKQKGLLYLGTGVSGGEEGALKGPSIMPGGSEVAYNLAKPYLEKIAAKDVLQSTCCARIGEGGAGHFVKMVHNGIEYAEMQLIAECYGLLRWGRQWTPQQIADLFEQWLSGECNSYLLEITVDILRKKEGEQWLIDLILDQAGNKGTGSWTTIAACELGVPIPTISAALFARYQSAFKAERVQAQASYQASYQSINIQTDQLKAAYQLARIINHHQGFHLIDAASAQFHWDIDLSALARIWTNGCIIRSTLMQELIQLFQSDRRILQMESIMEVANLSRQDLADTVGHGAITGIAIPCFSSALQYFNTYIQGQSTANIIQAQRDYFGAHTYRRVDDPNGPAHHTIWK
ncbi:MAG: NADP-dependent phosphogluconate dehydrogenase [Bacteroidota bacterium]